MRRDLIRSLDVIYESSFDLTCGFAAYIAAKDCLKSSGLKWSRQTVAFLGGFHKKRGFCDVLGDEAVDADVEGEGVAVAVVASPLIAIRHFKLSSGSHGNL